MIRMLVIKRLVAAMMPGLFWLVDRKVDQCVMGSTCRYLVRWLIRT